MKLKEIEIQKIETEVVNEYNMENKYYWSSRSVYAVEFEENIYPDSDKIWNEVTLIQVKFEENIILSKKIRFSDEHPINFTSMTKDWSRDLLYAYTQQDRWYSYRTKEQFYTDFSRVIENLESLIKL